MTPEDLKYIPEFSVAVDSAYASARRDCAAYDPRVREYYKSGISEALKPLAQALADARKELEQYRWRPYADCPKTLDMRADLFVQSGENRMRMTGCKKTGGPYWVYPATGSLVSESVITHYMPLPKPPEGA